ncbi:MAG: ATP-dependent zinc metalloprotease FtsH [Cyanobacteria bacterium]|nr:ATP-dependent zinc metalloprotease FtsH [Cyanobacteria bacterium GSL.Bin1]
MPIETETQRSRKEAKPNPFGDTLFLFLTFFFLINFLFATVFKSQPPEVAYSQFVQDVQAGKVERATISPDRIEYVLKSESKEGTSVFTTTPVPMDLELPQILRENKVEFSAPPPSNWEWLGNILSWVFPPLLFFGIWVWLFSRAQSEGPAALTIGKSKVRVYSEGDTGVTFADVAGVDEAKAELEEIVDFLQRAERYIRLGAKIPKGVLLVGPPGTGKTLLARAVAGEAGVPFFSISGSEFNELFVGIGASRVRDLFEQAKQQAPCIVFIDELDALGKSRAAIGPYSGVNDEREQTLNQLLSEMDGFEANTGVIILAATNRPEVLDPALQRPGRFDRQVVVDRPDKKGREAILKVHIQGVKLADDVDLEKIAARAVGFAGADLANLVNEAALLAARNQREAVTFADFNSAIERVVAGLERKSRVLGEKEKQIVAYHEVGHAIVGGLMPGANPVEKISIVPRGSGALGYTLQLPEEDRFLLSESEIRGQLTTLLGGRSAEELVFGEVSTGAADDIQKATDLAERAITLYGMSEELGPVAYERIKGQFLDDYMNPRRQVSPKVAEMIDNQLQGLINGALHVAKGTLEYNRELLEETAQVLLQKETLEGEELHAYLARTHLPEEFQNWLKTGELNKEWALLSGID